MPAQLVATSGPFKGLTFTFDEGTQWILGKDPLLCDFVIEDPALADSQVKIRQSKGEFFLTPLKNTPKTLINDEKITEETQLLEGDVVQIGATSFSFSEKKAAKKTKKKEKGYDDIFADLTSDSEEGPFSEERLEKEITKAPKEKEIKEPSAYDTIFEDVESLPEPFPFIADTPLILKVIAGPNAGAEIGIEKGKSYIIGKDPKTSDIIFQDLSVSRSHAKLSALSNGNLEIEDLGSKNGTLVNGTPIVDKKIVTPQDLISTGTTLFLIIDREAPQETIYSPVLPAAEPAEVVETPLEEEDKKHWKEEIIPTKYLVAAGSLAATFLIAFLSFFSLFKSEEITIKEKNPIAQITESLHKFSDVQFSFNQTSGKLFLAGHVLTNVDYVEIRYQIEQIPFVTSVEDNVVIDEGVAKAINDVLVSNADLQGIAIRVLRPGRFIATGYLQTTAEMAEVQAYLMTNFPYTDRLENQIVVEEVLNAKLTNLLKASDFSAVTFQLTHGNVMLSGVYNSAMEGQYETTLKEIQEIPGITSVKNFALPTTHVAAINLSNKYQVSGAAQQDHTGYNVILNGIIYTIGDSIDGMQIIHIERSTVLLEKDGVKYKIDYTPNYFTQ